MAQGTQQLEYLAGAIETTRGTVINTMTRKLYPANGSVTLTQEVGTVIPQESWGNYAPNRRAYQGLERVGLTVAGDWTYTDGPYWLNTAVAPLLSGVLSDTTAYTWTQTPTGATDTLKSLSIETGTADLVSVVGWRVPGLVCNDLSITFRKASIGGTETGCTFTAGFMTASGATQITSFTGALSDRTLISAIGTTNLAYINTTGSAHGTTADLLVREATFTLNNGYVYRDAFDGTNHAASLAKSGPRTATLTFQRYFDTKTELDAYVAKTSRRVQLIVTGALAGAATALNTLKLNFTGVPTAHTEAEVDGVWAANITLTSIYDSALSAEFQFVSINADSTTLS
jgi:hypothetical protein